MKRPKNPSRKVELPITDALIEALAEVMPIGDGAAPEVVYAWVTRTNNWRKAVAHYPNGWRLNLNFDRQGAISSSSASFRMVTKARAA